MGIIFNEDGTISFNEEEVKKVKEPISLRTDFKVSDDVIKKCDELSLIKGETLFVFDKRINNHFDIEVNKDYIYYSDESVFICNEFGFYPKSRTPLYDSEIKIADIYKRYDYVYKFLTKSLLFVPSEWNLGRDYEQIFNLDNLSITLQPNIIISIRVYSDIKYYGHFSKSELYKYISVQQVRDLKISSLLNP